MLCDVQHVRSDAEPIRSRNILRLRALRLLKLLQRLHCQHYVCRDFRRKRQQETLVDDSPKQQESRACGVCE